MKRTTLALDDELLRRLKERAAGEGRTLQSLANELLRQSMTRPRRQARFALRLQGWAAEEQPGTDLLDRDALHDLMDDRAR